MERETLRGVILEELLVYLIRNSGYRILVDNRQDPDSLEWRGNGLNVRGRGALHQADVLGQLAWTPAFTYPLRLFCEGKATHGRVGIQAVRNAVGVVSDVSQFLPKRSVFSNRRYSYRYALFATGGFTRDAIEMALAHEISVVDLSGQQFKDLRKLVHDLADAAPRNAQPGLVRALRARIRNKLGTWPDNHDSQRIQEWTTAGQNLVVGPRFDRLLESAGEQPDLFLATANGPFLLVLRPTDSKRFRETLLRSADHLVTIRWPNIPGLRDRWYLAFPDTAGQDYLASFALPGILGKWIFSSQSKALERAWDAKQEVFSEMTVYVMTQGRVQHVRLRFDPNRTPRPPTRRNA